MAEIIQTPITSARHFVVIDLKFKYDMPGQPATPLNDMGLDDNYDELVEWCSKNIAGKWYSSKQKRVIRKGGQLAMFNFEDPNDKAHFILKWM